MATRKFKVVKKWPGSVPVGTIGTLMGNGLDIHFYFPGCGDTWCKITEIEGFVEEVREPEEFWCVDCAGNILWSKGYDWLKNSAPYLRFRTKESAEKFRDGLKESHKNMKGIYTFDSPFDDIYDALNNRVNP